MFYFMIQVFREITTAIVDNETKVIQPFGAKSWDVRWDHSGSKTVTLWSMEYFKTITVADGEVHNFYLYDTGWEYKPQYPGTGATEY